MAQLFEDLRRRKVFRVGAAYGIVSWLLVEVASVVLPTFNAPEWVMQVLVVMAVLGFPVALVLAWAFEITPEGIKRDRDAPPADFAGDLTGRKLDFAIIALLVVAVSFLVIHGYLLEDETPQAPATSAQFRASEPPARKKSIAVLPFVNMSSDPEQEYFSDGLAEEILSLLARVPGLKVIGRTSSFAFKGTNQDLRTIAETLDVSTVLEGSVRKSGDRLRIVAQLISAEDGSHIWSESFDRTLTDVFDVQDSVAASIIDALQIHLGEAPTRGRPTENSNAYALFLQARAALNKLEAQTAIRLLLKAIELDPTFAEAYEQLAFSFWWQAEAMDAAEAQTRMHDAAAQALAINPGLLVAQALFEASRIDDYSFLREIEAFERVLREEPNHGGAADALIYELQQAGYFQEALGIAKRFVDLDPLSPLAHYAWYQALKSTGRRHEALASLEVAEQFDMSTATWELGIVNLGFDRDEIAIAHFEARLQEQGLPMVWVRDLVVGARDPETGQAYLDRVIPQILAATPEDQSIGMRVTLTWFYLSFGFVDRYFELIDELGVSGGEWSDAEFLVFAGTTDRRSGFTAHPMYMEVAEALGLVDLWEQRGPPDFCENIDDQWVCE
jgi:TolB-like protein